MLEEPIAADLLNVFHELFHLYYAVQDQGRFYSQKLNKLSKIMKLTRIPQNNIFHLYFYFLALAYWWHILGMYEDIAEVLPLPQQIWQIWQIWKGSWGY